MKETGIIMSGNHPKLILDGIKTQTRRVIKPQPTYYSNYILNWKGKGYWIESPRYDVTLASACPYGQVGDRLWVRETFSDIIFQVSESHSADYIYKANWDKPLPHNGKWKSSRFMPKLASRITLEITEVRVERVQEIGQVDIQKEGIIMTRLRGDEAYEVHLIENRRRFAELWDSLNAKRGYGWDINAWVWVLSFKLVK